MAGAPLEAVTDAHAGAVVSLAPLPDGSGFVSGSADKDVKVRRRPPPPLPLPL